MMTSVFAFHKEPRLTLVGAGPGDPELITLKAIRALQNANVVLYDALVSDAILDFIPVGVPAIPVGKRAGQHSYSQDEINDLMVEFAYLYGHVVRLKGGDPFVFGRGMEEIEYAISRGVRASAVPGISSALAVPAAANIPVTARGVSESFWVVTGTTMSGRISDDVALAAQSTATVIILMGLNKLDEITEIFSSHGKTATPVAVIQNGTLPDQRIAVGSMKTIAAEVRAQAIQAPAVIVIGEVVAYSENLSRITESLGQKNLSAYQ